MPEEPKADLVPDTEAANITHQTVKTLATWRWAGRGPAYYKVGRRIFYAVSDLEAWLTSQRREPAKAARPARAAAPQRYT